MTIEEMATEQHMRYLQTVVLPRAKRRQALEQELALLRPGEAPATHRGGARRLRLWLVRTGTRLVTGAAALRPMRRGPA